MGKVIWPPGVILVDDHVDMQCIHHIHLMSNDEIGTDWLMQSYAPSVHGEVKVEREAGAWHLRGSWPHRGLLEINAEGWPAPKRLYFYALDGDRVSIAIHNASVAWRKITEYLPQYAFVRTLPAKSERGQDVYDVALYDAEWMLTDCVAVGG